MLLALLVVSFVGYSANDAQTSPTEVKQPSAPELNLTVCEITNPIGEIVTIELVKYQAFAFSEIFVAAEKSKSYTSYIFVTFIPYSHFIPDKEVDVGNYLVSVSISDNKEDAGIYSYKPHLFKYSYRSTTNRKMHPRIRML